MLNINLDPAERFYAVLLRRWEKKAECGACLQKAWINNSCKSGASVLWLQLQKGGGQQTSSFFLRLASSFAGSGMGMSRGALSDAASLQPKEVWKTSQVCFSGSRTTSGEISNSWDTFSRVCSSSIFWGKKLETSCSACEDTIAGVTPESEQNHQKLIQPRHKLPPWWNLGKMCPPATNRKHLTSELTLDLPFNLLIHVILSVTEHK